MVRLIQLFIDDDFNKRLRVTASKIDRGISVNQTGAELYFSGVNAIWTDTVYLINAALVESYYDQLHQLSISNFIVFVYKNENEIISNKKIEKISDHFLPASFSQIELYSALVLARKSLQGYSPTIVTRKLINTSVSEIEMLIGRSGHRLFWKNISGMYVGANGLFLSDFAVGNIDDLVGKTDADLLDDSDALNFAAYDNQLLKKGEPFFDIEKEISFRNGVKRWIKMSKYPHLRDGVIIGIVGCYQILSESDKNSKNLFPDERLLQILMNSMPDTIYFKDNESRFVKINKAQADFIGVDSPDEAIGKTDFDFFDHDMAKEAFANEQKIIFDAQPLSRLENVSTKSGKTQWMNSIKAPVLDDNGNPIGIVGISRNVSELIKTEQRLLVERDTLQQLIDHIPAPIFFKDTESVFTRVNSALVELMGAKSAEEIIGKTDYDFYKKEDADCFRNDELEILNTGNPILNKIERSKWKDNTIMWVSTTKMPIKDEESDKFKGVVGISYDMTEQIQIKEKLGEAMRKLEEASNAKSNFLSNMSHEIRTPMNGIIGMTELLEMSGLTADQSKYIDVIKRSGYNLLNILNDILDLSKIESGKIKIEENHISVSEIVDDVMCLMTFAAKENYNELKVKIDSNIPEYLLGDSLRIKQILLNLVSNAVKFTKNGKVLIDVGYIGSSNSSHCLLFKVIDSGIGLSNDEINVIFAPFTQADASTTRKFGGTGLGLSICSQLVKMMGSKLKVKSKKGEGSVFYFELMLKKASVNEYNVP